jgi:hypothetical protein
MKKSLIVMAGLLFVFRTHAALVEYSYTGKGTHIGGGNQETSTYSGMMVYDTTAASVTFVSWRTDKTYHVGIDTHLRFTTVTGEKSNTYTVITASGSGTDTNGFYHLDDYMINGQNNTLQIATGTTMEFPKRLAGSNNRSLTPDASGQEALDTWGETMTFSVSQTKTDNDKHLSCDEVVNALVTSLQNKGYSQR